MLAHIAKVAKLTGLGECEAKTRSSDNIKANNDEFIKSNQNRNKLKNFKSCEYPPIQLKRGHERIQ